MQLRSSYDLTMFLSVAVDKSGKRLVQRWIDHRLDPAAVQKRACENDLENAKLVAGQSAGADVTLTE